MVFAEGGDVVDVSGEETFYFDRVELFSGGGVSVGGVGEGEGAVEVVLAHRSLLSWLLAAFWLFYQRSWGIESHLDTYFYRVYQERRRL